MDCMEIRRIVELLIWESVRFFWTTIAVVAKTLHDPTNLKLGNSGSVQPKTQSLILEAMEDFAPQHYPDALKDPKNGTPPI